MQMHPSPWMHPLIQACTLLAQEAKPSPLCALPLLKNAPKSLQTLTLSFSSLPSPHLNLSSEQVNNEPHPYPFPSFSLSLAKPKRPMAYIQSSHV
jgi:hypothetical protein